MVAKEGKTTNYFRFFCCCWIRDPRWKKISIRDKHPGSATLQITETANNRTQNDREENQ
jgi:hypothetical protein